MTDTGQDDVDPESTQNIIENQSWKKSKIHSPQRDEDKHPPRGRGRGWRRRMKESPIPGNTQEDKVTSRGQRSLDHARDTRRDDKLEDDRQAEEARRRRLQDDRRRDDERRWEEDRGWKGGKEISKQATKQDDSTTETTRRKPRRAAQEVYVPRARRQAQQLYVPKARREAEQPKSISVEKECPRTTNSREPPEKKRIITKQTQQKDAKNHQEVKSQKSSRRTEELRHKSEEYQESRHEKHSSATGRTDKTGDFQSSERREKGVNKGWGSGGAAKKHTAKKQFPSHSSSESRSDNSEAKLGDTGEKFIEPKSSTNLNKTSTVDTTQTENIMIAQPQSNLVDQIDTETEASKHNQVDMESCDLSGSAAQTFHSINQSAMPDDSTVHVSGLKQSECEMPDVVCNVTDGGDESMYDIPDHIHEIHETISSNSNQVTLATSTLSTMEVSEDPVQEHGIISAKGKASYDEEKTDMSGKDEDRNKDDDSRGVMESRMESEEEVKDEERKGNESNLKSHVDSKQGSNTMDIMSQGDDNIPQASEASNDNPSESLRDDDDTSINVDNSSGNVTIDMERNEERTSLEEVNVLPADANSDTAPERTSGLIEKEKDNEHITHDITVAPTNDTREQVGDEQSVEVNKPSIAINHANNDHDDNVLNVDEPKQVNIFKDTLTHSEDYGSSSSDAAYGDVERSSSSQEDAMDAVEEVGGDDGGDDGDSWDALFDDTGDSLKPEEEEELAQGIGKVKVSMKKPKHDYYNWQPKDNMDYSAYEHVIEVYDIPVEFKTPDLVMAFSEFKNKGFDIKWVDDTHALGIFATALVARDALGLMNPMFRTRPLALATRESKMKAKRSIEFLQPFKAKPETTAVAARRLISGALGIKTKVTREQREAERNKLRQAKDKRRADRQQTNDIWEGNI